MEVKLGEEYEKKKMSLEWTCLPMKRKRKGEKKQTVKKTSRKQKRDTQS